MEFEENRIPLKGLTTLTAYMSDLELHKFGKSFATEVITKLIRDLVYIHRVDLDNMVTEYIMSNECKEYVKIQIQKAIDETIKQEIDYMFKRDK